MPAATCVISCNLAAGKLGTFGEKCCKMAQATENHAHWLGHFVTLTSIPCVCLLCRECLLLAFSESFVYGGCGRFAPRLGDALQALAETRLEDVRNGCSALAKHCWEL